MQANGKVHEANFNAECFLVDAEDYLDARSMLYVPVVHTGKIFPIECAKERDLIYLASAYPAKRHDLLVSAVKGSGVTGHLHPVARDTIDLTDTLLTTSNWYERDVVELLRTSRIAVYPGDQTSNPAAIMISGMAPTWVATIGNPIAIASRRAKGAPS